MTETHEVEYLNQFQILNPNAVQALNDYQDKVLDTAIYPGADEDNNGLAVMYTSMGLAGEAGEVLNKVKKVLRDNDGIFDAERKAIIAKELGDVTWYVAALANELNVDFATLIEANLAKLAARKTSGTLGGNGDDR